jgi:hypothetical protein
MASISSGESSIWTLAARSSRWLMDVEPTIGAETPGWARTQARAIWAIEMPLASAMVATLEKAQTQSNQS